MHRGRELAALVQCRVVESNAECVAPRNGECMSKAMLNRVPVRVALAESRIGNGSGRLCSVLIVR